MLIVNCLIHKIGRCQTDRPFFMSTGDLVRLSDLDKFADMIAYANDAWGELQNNISWFKKHITDFMVAEKCTRGNTWPGFEAGWYSSPNKSFEWLSSSSPYYYLTRGEEVGNALLMDKPSQYKALMDLTVKPL